MLNIDENLALVDLLKVGSYTPNAITHQTIAELCKNSSEEAALIRLLLGTAGLRHKPSRRHIKQRANFAVLGLPTTTVSTRAGLRTMLAKIDIDSEQLDNYLRGTLRQRLYYRDILLEILHYLCREEAGESSIAFVHLYRCLERISFAFPVIYASSTDDFKGAYSALRDFLVNGDAGELNFFSKFVELSLDSGLLDTSSTLRFTAMKETQRANALGIVKGFLAQEHIVSEIPAQEISIKSRAIVGLTINLRNRFFHFSSGHTKNISLTDVLEPDRFFGCLNKTILNWLSVIYFAVLRKKIERY